MAWGKVKGFKSGNIERNYPEYILIQGNIALSTIIAKKYVPLTIAISNIRGYKSSNGTFYKPYLKIVTNGTAYTPIATNMVANPDTWCSGNSYGGSWETVYFDLEAYFKDFDKLKNISEISVIGANANNAPMAVGAVVKWLVPEDDIPSNGKLWLYKDGNECTDVTGGWNFVTGTSSAYFKKYPTYMTLEASTVISITKQIDIYNYQRLIMEYTVPNELNPFDYRLGIAELNGSSISVKRVTGTQGNLGTLILDIRKVNVLPNKPFIQTISILTANALKVTKIWLE